ncbi:hypothetical protein [Arthrobacter sp. 2MCAF14]
MPRIEPVEEVRAWALCRLAALVDSKVVRILTGPLTDIHLPQLR